MKAIFGKERMSKTRIKLNSSISVTTDINEIPIDNPLIRKSPTNLSVDMARKYYYLGFDPLEKNCNKPEILASIHQITFRKTISA